ncbi:hypothetical protein HED60_08935 [Planctomycetales bacterium ZRK34]|nr:hypothetical protein HED60_08935 [Planctomycetales bacterium ZRK34]
MWLVYVYLDQLWTNTLQAAVSQGESTYGEIYGPLSIVRPVSFWLAITLTGLCIFLMFKPPAARRAGDFPVYLNHTKQNADR